MTNRRTAARQQNKPENRAKKPPASESKPASDAARLNELPAQLSVAGTVSGTAHQAAQLSDSRLSAVQKQALATRISQAQGNQHLQRLLASRKDGTRAAVQAPISEGQENPQSVILSKKDGDKKPASAPGPAPSTAEGAGGVVEMPPIVITGSPLTQKERKFFKELGFSAEVGATGLSADNPEFERRESRPNVKVAPFSFSKKPDSLDFDAHFEVTPASAVAGSAPSSATAWPARGHSGSRYNFAVSTSDIADLNLTVKLVFSPLKLTREAGVFTIAAPPPIQKTLKVKDKRQEFLDSQTYGVFLDQTKQQWTAGTNPARNVEYANGRHEMGVWAAASKPNPGIGVNVGFKVKRGMDVIKVEAPKPWQDGKWLGPGLHVMCGQLSDASDTYSFEVTFSKSDGSPARALISGPVVIHGWGLGEADVKRIAVRDQTTIDNVVAGLATDPKPEAREAHGAITARRNRLRVVPMTPCHDTAKRVHNFGKDPAEYTAFFCGTDYSNIKIAGRNCGGLTYADDEFGVVVTDNPKTGVQTSSDAIKQIIVHEYVHIRDRRAFARKERAWQGRSWWRKLRDWVRARKLKQRDALWNYKTEFRAYWADGRFDSKPDAYDPFLTGKGPKTPRSRAIFELLYGNKLLYGYVKKAYDSDTAFKAAVNAFVAPEGKTVQHPARLTLLHLFIQSLKPGRHEPARWTMIKPLFQLHRAMLQPGDGAYMKAQKDWQDLLKRQFVAEQLADVTRILGI